ncbi:hypothetical protein LCL99_15250 [Halomonas denitrificans]|uniref:hypothetical protein n=1 Tax=Halomonas TaxID=2745 RepID=UPI001C98E31F|nr:MULTISPECIES: hypothetical protein [Halomonas]MBY5930056.1 hypothetical protein [Halomonas sp. DP8Y7-3]MCA0975829.1 hypothetical protein [Halomonas denitrificans]
MLTFTPVGQVNGVFDIFFYEPSHGTFTHAQPLSGHTLERDIDDYVIAISRNGPGQILRFFTIENQDFTFQFEINPYAPGSPAPGREFTCDISAVSSEVGSENERKGATPEDVEWLSDYCIQEPPIDREPRNIELLERAVETDRVPTDTLFYCRLDNNTHIVTISRVPGGMRYEYGRIGTDSVELALEQPLEQVQMVTEDDNGQSRFGEIRFTSGPYSYIASYRYDLFDTNGKLLPSGPDRARANPTFRRSLMVTKDGDRANPVFARDCLIAHSYDAILASERE